MTHARKAAEERVMMSHEAATATNDGRNNDELVAAFTRWEAVAGRMCQHELIITKVFFRTPCCDVCLILPLLVQKMIMKTMLFGASFLSLAASVHRVRRAESRPTEAEPR